MEIWKDVIGYEGLYQVSNLGNVKTLSKIIVGGRYNCPRLFKEKILKPHKGDVSLTKNGIKKTFDAITIMQIAFYGFKPKGERKECATINGIVTRRTVVQNIKKSKKDKTSVFTGVHWHKRSDKWRSMICINKKDIHLGVFDDEKEASIMYEKAVRYEFLYKNVPKLFREELKQIAL